jgi:protein SCO1/2
MSLASRVLLLVSVALACREQADGGPGRYSATGTVEEVDAERAQVLIDHGDVEGLMPAMTMNFAVPDADLLERLAPGQVIDFQIEFTGHSYEVVAAEVVGEGSADEGWARLRDGLVRTRPAPAFELIDQDGESVTLASLGDRVLLVDFIYTSCPGPCPVQTANQVALQRQIPEALRSAVHFVSISLDPEVDRPEVLKRYALDRGADLSNWSFLTGPTDVLADLVRRWGVGTLRQPDGSIDHTLITFLVKDGVVLEHYTSLDGRDGRLLADVLALTQERADAQEATTPDSPGTGPAGGDASS